VESAQRSGRCVVVRYTIVAMLLVVGCRQHAARDMAAFAPAPPPDAVSFDATSLDAAPGDASVDAERPVGAVAIPGTQPIAEDSTNERDLTVRLDELPAVDAAWRKRITIRYAGRVMIALRINPQRPLELVVVDTVIGPQNYPNELRSIPIAPIASKWSAIFSPRDEDPETGEFRGPIMFAIRVLPEEGAPETERRQYAMFTVGHALFVADKRMTETQWTPRLRVDMPRSTEIVAVNPGWH
jgi:hypothetical protein